MNAPSACFAPSIVFARTSSGAGTRTGRREQRFQDLGSGRLREVVIESGVPRTLAVRFLTVARQRGDDGALGPRLRPQTPGDLVAAHAGKTNVEQDDLRL